MQKAKVLCIVVSFENIYESVQGFHNGTMAHETNACHILTEYQV